MVLGGGTGAEARQRPQAGTEGVGGGAQARAFGGSMTQKRASGWKMLGGAVDWQTAATGAWIPIQV